MLDLRVPVCPALGLMQAVQWKTLPCRVSLVKLSCMQPLQHIGDETSPGEQLLACTARLSTSCCQQVSKK